MNAQPRLRHNRPPHPQGFPHLLDAAFLRRHKGKAVAANHHTGLTDKAVTNLHPRANMGTVQYNRIGPDPGILADRDMGPNPRTRPNLHPRANRHKRPNRRARANLRRWVNVGHGMHPRHNRHPGVQEPRQPRHGQPRSRRKYCSLQPQCLPIRPRPQHRRPCLPPRQPVAITRVHRQSQILRPRHRRLGRALNDQIKIARCLGPHGLRYVTDPMAHPSPHRETTAARPSSERPATPPRPPPTPDKPGRRGHRHRSDIRSCHARLAKR